jgi:hypothetical protein
MNKLQVMSEIVKSAESQGQTTEWLSETISGQDGPTEEEQWVSVVEPTTINTLLDTMTAQLDNATAMCALKASEDPIGFLKFVEYSRYLIENASKISEGTDRADEIHLAKACLLSSLAETAFRYGHVTLPAYRDELVSAYDQKYDLSSSVRGLCDRADAFMNFVTTTRSTVDFSSLSSSDLLELTSLQWRYLTKALNDLTAATKLPDAVNLAKLHLRRGDAELLRYRLGEAPTLHSQATQNAALLLRNAAVCYRGAAKIAGIDSNEQEEMEAVTKEAVVNKLNGNGGGITELLRKDRPRIVAVLEEMKEDGLLDGGLLVE